jgi:hypothetical protein
MREGRRPPRRDPTRRRAQNGPRRWCSTHCGPTSSSRRIRGCRPYRVTWPRRRPGSWPVPVMPRWGDRAERRAGVVRACRHARRGRGRDRALARAGRRPAGDTERGPGPDPVRTLVEDTHSDRVSARAPADAGLLMLCRDANAPGGEATHGSSRKPIEYRVEDWAAWVLLAGGLLVILLSCVIGVRVHDQLIEQGRGGGS